MLGRIERSNPQLNAFITVTGELALVQAKKTEAELFGPRGRKGKLDRGPLHGIPLSLKDNIQTKGIRTTAGSKILQDYMPSEDAEVVSLLKEAGAVILGKTNLHEFAYGVTTNNPHYGPACNPWDLERIPGGSSGGSAAAVAAGLCYGSVGTDTGGSIRIPAALCGVAGLKPTLGRISCEGIVPLSVSLDCAGPLGRTVGDIARIIGVLYQRVAREPDMASPSALRAKPGQFCLGIPRQLFFDAVGAEVHSAFEAAIKKLVGAGISTVDVSVPMLDETEEAGNQIAWAEALHYHQQQGYYPARAAEYGEDVRARLEMGNKVSAVDYLHAMEIRSRFLRELHLGMADAGADALAYPSTAVEAPLISEEMLRVGRHGYPARALLLRHNRPANLAGVPAVSVNCGFTKAGMPIGLQFMGAVSSEPVLLRIAKIFEQLQEEMPRPPV